MKESIFTKVKANVTALEAAEGYGLQVGRNGMCLCPFHDDRHPSMKVDENFYCFGCQAHGDAVDLTAKLFDLAPYDAAKKLIRDFGIDEFAPSVNEKRERYRKKVLENRRKRNRNERILHAKDVLLAYEKYLQRKIKENTPKDGVIPDVYADACLELGTISYLTECFLTEDNDSLEKYCNEHEKELENYERIVREQ